MVDNEITPLQQISKLPLPKKLYNLIENLTLHNPKDRMVMKQVLFHLMEISLEADTIIKLNYTPTRLKKQKTKSLPSTSKKKQSIYKTATNLLSDEKYTTSLTPTKLYFEETSLV